eukprot:8037700-Prorocentrum_lima.AAC.1
MAVAIGRWKDDHALTLYAVGCHGLRHHHHLLRGGVGATVPTLSKLGLIPFDGNAAATIPSAVGELA